MTQDEYSSGARPWPVGPEDWESAAAASMDPRDFDYVAGGAGGEATVRANRAAYERVALVPRVLVANAQRNLAVEIFGARASAPLMLAPVGVLELAHRDAELAVARAAAATGIPIVLSSQASTSLERVADEIGEHPRWFQLYWVSERAIVESFVARAEAAGYGAIVLTVDNQTVGLRDRDVRNRYLPFALGRGIAQYASDPVFRARLDHSPEQDPAAAGLEMIRIFPNIGLSWADLGWLRERTSLPLVLKGVLCGEDARLAADHGVDGLIVSNHGGRQVDGAIAALDALADVREAFGGPLLLDGGVRRGSDALKALALGADAVLVGRPYVYALAVGGEAGVRQWLQTFIAEIDLTLALTGGTDAGGYDGRFVRRVP